MLFTGTVSVKAEEDIYYVVDSSNGQVIDDFSSYRNALRFYNKAKDEYDNLSLYQNDKVIETEYAIVRFNKNDACSLQIEYSDNSYINGCYGEDAAYLYSDNDEIYFMLSGATGHTDISNLTIIPVDEYPDFISVYENIEGSLYHNVKSSIDSAYYTFSIELDRSPDYLVKDKYYYSYDGHYFYENYWDMIDDYNSDGHDQSVNKEAYYNYYQYLPFRSESNYSYEEVEAYLINFLGINGRLVSYEDDNGDNANDYVNRSQYFDCLESFFVSENIFGVNAMSLLSLSMYESSYGKSLSSYLSNNLFRNAAFTESKEKDIQKYETLANSVYAYAKYYINQKYCNPLKESYNGAFFGNKTSGMNVSYSADPYFGEKVASIYHKMDKDMGYQDRNSECIGLVSGDIEVCSDEKLSNRIYKVKDAIDYAFAVLEETDISYKIILDKCLDGDSLYNRENEIGYIAKDNVILLNKEKMHEAEYSEYSFDFNGGSIASLKTVSFTSSKDLCEIEPLKDGYEFIGYVDGIAEYKKIASITLVSGLDETYGPDDYPILNGEIVIYYEDGSHSYKELNSEMIADFNTEEGKATIFYKGVSTQKELTIKDDTSIKEKVNASVNELLKTYSQDKYFDDVTLEYVKENIAYADISFNEIRSLDLMAKEKYGTYPAFYIGENDYDLSFSGLALSFDFNKKRDAYQLYDDTYYVNAEKLKNDDEEILMKYAEGYGFTSVGAIDLSFRFNLNEVEPNAPIVVEAKLLDKDSTSIYTVYHLKDNGDIEKIRTIQSDSYIQFIVRESGAYIFLSKPSANTYAIEDTRENISAYNNGTDSFTVMVEILVFFAMMLYIFVGFVIYYRLKNLNTSIWERYWKLLRSMRN